MDFDSSVIVYFYFLSGKVVFFYLGGTFYLEWTLEHDIRAYYFILKFTSKYNLNNIHNKTIFLNYTVYYKNTFISFGSKFKFFVLPIPAIRERFKMSFVFKTNKSDSNLLAFAKALLLSNQTFKDKVKLENITAEKKAKICYFRISKECSFDFFIRKKCRSCGFICFYYGVFFLHFFSCRRTRIV